jgi:archaemetzincin
VRAVAALLLWAGTAHAETVCLQPLGKLEPRLLPIVVRGIEHVFGMTTEVLPGKPLPEAAWYPPRKRWRAEKILDHLLADPPAHCTYVMGFTREDVATTVRDKEDWGVLGLAYLGRKVGVVSSFRMKHRSPRRVAERAVKVVNHELGHVFGMDHDDRQAGCMMNDANGTVKTVDGESGLLCAHERETFERLLGHTLPVRERFDWATVLGQN